jgi:signal transduction histidine kinase
VAAAWILAVAGPVLLTLALLPFRPGLGPGGFLFCTLLVVMVAAAIGGTWPALAGVVLGDLAGAYFFAPPDSDLRIQLNADLVSVAAFAAAGTAAAILIGRLTGLAGEQTRDRQVEAALRRVATLVAHGTPADELFSVVTDEVGRLMAADFARMARYDSDDSLTYLAAWSRTGQPFPVGSRWPLAGQNVGKMVARTGRPARMDDLAGASGPLAAQAREWGVRSISGVPIMVEDRIWGVMVAGSGLRRAPPPDTEARLASFMDLLAAAISNADSRAALTRLAEEQAALSRVATLVARGAPADELFAAVAAEVGQVLPVDYAGLGRYAPDGMVTTLTGWSRGRPVFESGTPRPLGGENIASVVARTGRPARMDSYADASGAVGAAAREAGFGSTVGTPILVEGRLWGVMEAGSTERPVPADTEVRLSSFTDLLATAISNADNRAALTQLAEEQAALRRVATLVARGAPPDEVFAAVSEEAGRLLDAAQTAMNRYESDGTATIMASWSRAGDPAPVGTRERLGGSNLTTIVAQSHRPARMESYATASGPHGGIARETGFRSAVGTPIIVQGRLWGVMVTASADEHPLAEGTEARLASFTELVATAVSNAESLAALTASRARVVATADETRRQIERDLHDGAQQRLVSLALAVRTAQATVPAELSDLDADLGRVADGLVNALDDLREMARGIHPAILAEGGLGAALKTLARRSTVPVQLDAPATPRLPERVEVAAYYLVSEALTNAAKYANASVIQVSAEIAGPVLHLRVRDDGVGGADAARGTGLIGLKDRVEALGGTVTVQSPAGDGTTLHAELPLTG